MRRLLALAGVAFAVAGCGAGEGVRDEGGQAVVNPIADAGADKRTVSIYLLRYGQLVKVQRTVPGARPDREALRSLLSGPNVEERAERYTTAIPNDTELSIFQTSNGGVAVDLVAHDDKILRTATTDDIEARQRQLMLKEIVYTLTEFPDIENVEVRLNGESVPLGNQFPGTTLTRRFFDDAQVAAWHDQTRCDGNQEPTGKGKRLRVPDVSVADGVVAFKGETNAKRGAIVVQVEQDKRLLRSLEEDDNAVYNQPAEGGTDPCNQFSGRIEIPWGVRGRVTFRVIVQPEGDEKPRVVERDVVIGGS